MIPGDYAYIVEALDVQQEKLVRAIDADDLDTVWRVAEAIGRIQRDLTEKLAAEPRRTT